MPVRRHGAHPRILLVFLHKTHGGRQHVIDPQCGQHDGHLEAHILEPRHGGQDLAADALLPGTVRCEVGRAGQVQTSCVFGQDRIADLNGLSGM